jgi:hypothetical protein
MRMNALVSLVLPLVALAADKAVTIDRIAVIIGNHAIKTSDINRDVRLTAFLNQERLDLGSQSKKQSAERLIDQQLIRQEMATGNYNRPSDTQAEGLLAQLAHDRFKGSNAEFDKALLQYGLTRGQLAAQLLWQLTVLQFIDQRFRAGVFVSDDDVQRYVQQHQDALRKDNPGANAGVLESRARDILEGARINDNFAMWVDETRKSTRIEYKEEAF